MLNIDHRERQLARRGGGGGGGVGGGEFFFSSERVSCSSISIPFSRVSCTSRRSTNVHILNYIYRRSKYIYRVKEREGKVGGGGGGGEKKG